MFTWSSVAMNSNAFHSDMYMDDAIIASAWNPSSGASLSASNVIFIQCESGSRVYIQCGPDLNCRPREHDHGLLTFSGFLVNADD